MALILGVFFLTGLVWFVWACIVATRRRTERASPSCPRCDRPKYPGAPLCYDCTTR